MTLFLAIWLIGFLVTLIWGGLVHGPLVWWAPFIILFTWPIGLAALIFDR